MNCVGYARVSTEDQAKENCSIPTQISKIESAAKHECYTLLRIFKDEGLSGSNPKRPGLVEMLDFCKQNQIDVVFVLDTDRLARDEALHFAIKAELHKYKTKVISVNQPMLNDTVEGGLLDSILAAVNAFYPKLTGRKTSASMLEKAKLGFWPGPARIGYQNAVDEKVPDGFARNIMILDEQQAPLVERSFRLFATGRYTLDQLADQMFEEGLRSRPTKKARPDRKVVKSAMADILRNSFYTGEMEYMGEIYEGKYPPIIDKTTFIRCNDILDQHNQYADRKRKHQFLLSGYIFCGICGRPYTADYRDKKGKSCYHCSADATTHSNKRQNIDTDALELLVSNLFKGLHLSQSLIQKIMVHAKHYLSENHDHIDIAKKNLLARQEKLETRRNNIETDFADRTIDSESYSRQITPIKPELKAIEKDLAKLGVKRQNNADVFEQLVHLADGIYTAYCNASPKRKRALIDLFWDKIEVEDKKIKKAVPTKAFRVMLSKEYITAEGTASKNRKSLLWLPGSDSNGQPFR